MFAHIVVMFSKVTLRSRRIRVLGTAAVLTVLQVTFHKNGRESLHVVDSPPSDRCNLSLLHVSSSQVSRGGSLPSLHVRLVVRHCPSQPAHTRHDEAKLQVTGCSPSIGTADFDTVVRLTTPFCVNKFFS